MNKTNTTIVSNLLIEQENYKNTDNKKPFREELYDMEQIYQLGTELAQFHELHTKPKKIILLNQLHQNKIRMEEIHKILHDEISSENIISPSRKWIIENYYIIIDQIRSIQFDLSDELLENLPQLTNGKEPNIPRIYEILIELISHTDSQIDINNFQNIIHGYQEIVPLTLRELWSIPSLFRLILIENIVRIAENIIYAQEEYKKATTWIETLKNIASTNPKKIIVLVAQLVEDDVILTNSFLYEVFRQLKSLDLDIVTDALNFYINSQGYESTEIIFQETEIQTQNRISIGNCINFLKSINNLKWGEIIVDISKLDQILNQSPDGIYDKLDVKTQDQYRHQIEKISKVYNVSETDVAEKVVSLCKNANNIQGTENKEKHSGYFLIDKGYPKLISSLGLKRTIKERCNQKIKEHAFSLYLGTIISITALSIFILFKVIQIPSIICWESIVILLLGGYCLLFTTIQIVNLICSYFITPKLIPKIEFKKGIPKSARTLIVITMLMFSEDQIKKQLRQLERIYLSNIDDALNFGILTDLPDSDKEITPAEEELIELTKQLVEDLNQKYSINRKNIFLMFQRKRTFSPYNKKWMGWERKRGCLLDLNSAILGSEGLKKFHTVVADLSLLHQTKYVITLDMDTYLPFNTARRLVGSMEHPLNHPTLDKSQSIVKSGYVILQPIMEINYTNVFKSRYVHLSNEDRGFVPYSRLVSNYYQDFFSQGSFMGKGIYNVEIFSKLLQNRFPENLILSHDMIEGCFAKSGIVSDIKLYETTPINYINDAMRHHRWIRGDWQVLAWLRSKVPTVEEGKVKNTLNSISRWKIFENMRLSLVPFIFISFFLFSIFFTDNPLMWLSFIFGIFLFPQIITSLRLIISRSKQVSLFQYWQLVKGKLTKTFSIQLMNVILWPFEAFWNLDAILRSFSRKAFFPERLLDWKTAHEAKQKGKTNLSRFYRIMWFSPFFGFIFGISIWFFKPDLIIIGIIFSILWVFSPAIMNYLSQPRSIKKKSISIEDQQFLRIISRKTWNYFEKFVSTETSWLPPDNFQEIPNPVLAKRTSPTNIGLYLLTNLAAFEFGYIGINTLLQRIKKTLASMENLERYRGHFLNWYDLTTLTPLHPKYVSTVDSGNLAGCLFTLKEGLHTLLNRNLLSNRMFTGLKDLIAVMEELFKNPIITELSNKLKEPVSTITELKERYEEIQRVLTILYTYNQKLFTPEMIEWISVLEIQLNEAQIDFMENYEWLDNLSEVANIAQKLKEQFATQDKHIPKLDFIINLNQESRENLSLINKIEYKDDIGNIIDLILSKTQWINWLEANHFSYECVSSLKTEYFAICKKISLINNQIESVGLKCLEFANMEYHFLIKHDSNLLSIGFNVDQHQLDSSVYDLLASEVRIASFVAIAIGKLDIEHWFALGRQYTELDKKKSLISWGGTMFEYFMPLLIMPNYPHSLLDQTYESVIECQIEYGKKNNIPWGVSESGYYLTDADSNYQYQAFGVPGLGLKQGLAEDVVIAPYASALGLMISEQKSFKNIKRMYQEGFHGQFGFYEAIDYTVSRIPPNTPHQIVYSYMAHHQAMIFLSFANSLFNGIFQRYFKEEPHFNSSLLLLQEELPPFIQSINPHYLDIKPSKTIMDEVLSVRTISDPMILIPEVHLLSNGNYHVMVNQAGGGYSRYGDMLITSWQQDLCKNQSGFFCYLKDLTDHKIGSIGYQPTQNLSSDFRTIFSSARAEFFNNIGPISMHTTLVVSPEENIEIRRVKIINNSNIPRKIQICTYFEPILDYYEDAASHPAFKKMFIETQIIPELKAILTKRRNKTQDAMKFIFHSIQIHNKEIQHTSFETNREEFIGRNRSIKNPKAIYDNKKLSHKEGYTLDPCSAISVQLLLKPDEDMIVDLFLGVAETKEKSLAIINLYKNRHISDRMFDLSWTTEKLHLRRENIKEKDTLIYERFASSILYNLSNYRAEPKIILSSTQKQDSLWALSISGDIPIILAFLENSKSMPFFRDILKLYHYLSYKGLIFNIIFINKDNSGYRQEFQDQIFNTINNENTQNTSFTGKLYLFRWELLSDEHKTILQATSRIILGEDKGSLNQQSKFQRIPEVIPRKFIPTKKIPGNSSLRKKVQISSLISKYPPKDLIFYNGYGGFTKDGKEYIIFGKSNNPTPRPWTNVLSNPNFGTIVTESGGSYTWNENSHEYRITPWFNDYVSDDRGEAYYLRNDETGNSYSLTSCPMRGKNDYITRHGLGYTVYEYSEDSIDSEMWIYVDLHEPVKFTKIILKNRSNKTKKLSLFGYVEWVLGSNRTKNAPFITTKYDLESGTILVRNSFNRIFGNKYGFFGLNKRGDSYSCDRVEFVGRERDLSNPRALTRIRLSKRSGAGMDPCAAIHKKITLSPNEEKQYVFFMGVGKDEQNAMELVQKNRYKEQSQRALEEIWAYWEHTLDIIHLETPDPGINILTNNWLLYQVISCRIWARTSFYQSGGAFGFRDQLQDMMALIYTNPDITRSHIITSSSRQFVEGDVQHWWHPPNNYGVRTHFSDDLLWLPYVVNYYCNHTQDWGVLDDMAPFLEGRPLPPEEESYFDLPVISSFKGSIYEHCKRAIVYAMKYGKHGLPLMGSGDWNDGMNLVGKNGGESVWLGFFLLKILKDFKIIAEKKGDIDFGTKLKEKITTLGENIEKYAWDGHWYKRAFFSNGKALGSQKNAECTIDSLPQSWSVLAEGKSPEHSMIALESAYNKLVLEDKEIIKLFTPPFDKSSPNPGYIQDYPPGIRENGGQYTHGAIWLAMAFAKLGNNDRLWQLITYLNPIRHGNSNSKIDIYKVEPYVISADIYTDQEREGQGGWSWYTGSAGWMYQLIIKDLLGIITHNPTIRFTPHLPLNWPDFDVHYRFYDTTYHLHYISEGSKKTVKSISLDGEIQEDLIITLVNDREDHHVDINME